MPDETPTADALPIPPLAPPEPLSLGAVLRIAPLRRLWYAQVVSVFGDFLALYAVIYFLTYNLHGSAQQITGIQIAYMLPIAVLGVIAGVFVDRWSVKPTLVSSDFLRAALCLLLLLVSTPFGFYGALAAISVISSFFAPAQGKALRAVVPMHGMRSAQALMQQVMFVMRIIGGPIAVTIVAVFGAKVCYILDALSFLASGTLISTVALSIADQPAPSPATPATAAPAKTGVARVLHDMREGASFIVHHAALFFVVLALAAGMFVMGCFGPLIAVYVRDVLHATGRMFAITSGMIGLGLLSGINILNAVAKRVKNTVLVYFGLLGIAVGTLMLAAMPHVWSAIIGLYIIGFAAGAIIVPAQTMIQEETPQAMLGRVGSTVMSLIFTAQILGLVLSGILANYTSVRGIFALCTAMLVVLVVAGKLWMEPEKQTLDK